MLNNFVIRLIGDLVDEHLIVALSDSVVIVDNCVVDSLISTFVGKTRLNTIEGIFVDGSKVDI